MRGRMHESKLGVTKVVEYGWTPRNQLEGRSGVGAVGRRQTRRRRRTRRQRTRLKHLAANTARKVVAAVVHALAASAARNLLLFLALLGSFVAALAFAIGGEEALAILFFLLALGVGARYGWGRSRE